MMLRDQVVLITGASRGIGAACARRLGARGAKVGVNYFGSPDAAKDVVQSIIDAGGSALAVKADVRDPEQVRKVVEAVETGLGPIDTLVNNASIGFPMKPFTDFAWEEFEAKLTGELRSAFNCCQAVLPGMIERGRGNIICISSTLSRHASPGFVAHCTAKSGLDGFVRALAIEHGPHGIRANTVAPGLTITDATAGLPPEQKDMIASMTPLGRNAEPDDVAGVVLALASGQFGFVSGAYIPVCGGVMQM